MTPPTIVLVPPQVVVHLAPMADTIVSKDVAAFAGIVLAAVLAVYGGLRSGIGQVRSATASEVEKLGARLDLTNARVATLERNERALRAYIADDHAEHRANGWPITPLPQEIA